jgi:hypothetical protein
MIQDRLIAGLLAASLLGSAPAVAGQPEAAQFVEEAFVCLQVVMARDSDGTLDMDQLQQPRYRIGARLSGQPCAQTRLHEVPAAQLPAVVATLRSLGDRGALPAPTRDALAQCERSGASLQWSERAPQVEGDQLTVWLQACDNEVQVHAPANDPTAGADRLAITLSPVAPADTTAAAPETSMLRRWRPDEGRIDATFKREDEAGRKEDEVKLRLDTRWVRGINETRVQLDADIERNDDEPWDREASGRLNWIRQSPSGWFSLHEGYIERNQLELSGVDEDYRLLQASLGGGYRFAWDDRATLRAALLWNWFYLDLINRDGNAHLDAPSLYLDGDWNITSRLSLQSIARVYHWPDDDTGVEIDTDLAYDFTKHLGFGLRWRYRRDAASLDRDDEELTEMFLRYRF